MHEETLGGRLERAARSERGVRFLDQREQPAFLTYEALLARARGAAAAMQDLGLRPGDRAGVILPTAPSFYDAFFGALLAGLVPVPLYPPVRLGRLHEYHERTARMLMVVGARVVLTDRRIARLLGETVERARPRHGCVAVEDLASGTPREVATRPDEVAFIQFSSGTTAAPKPVPLTHQQVLANVRAILQAFFAVHPEGPERTHAGVSWLPLYHDMGLVGCALAAVHHPGDLTLLPPELFVARPASWLRAISRYRGTISAAPNFAYALCAERIRDDELAGIDLGSWRIALDGAEPVTPSTLRAFAERFAPYGLRREALTPVYGLAEAALAVTFSRLDAPFVARRFDHRLLVERGLAVPATSAGYELVSVGRALPGYAVRIAGAGGDSMADGRVGHVWVSGPSVVGGTIDTGDLGFLFEGELYVVGREKDVIILRGRKYAPEDLEHGLGEVEGARRGCWAAVGVVHPEADGEELVIFVERAKRTRRTEEEIEQRVRQLLVVSRGLVPSRVVVLEPGTLPRTSSGKISRAETRRRWLLGTLSPPRKVSPVRVLVALARSRLAYARSRRRASEAP